MRIYLDQPHGIGDVLYIQKIAKTLAQKHEVVIPVLESLKWIGEYLEQPNISYPVMGTDFEHSKDFESLHTYAMTGAIKTPIIYDNKFVFLALGSSYQALQASMMTSKYKFMDMDYSDWADWVQIKRNTTKENKLLSEYPTTYKLINENCSGRKIDISVSGHVIYLYNNPDYTLFDWLSVIEHASEIITIDTSLVLLCEILKVKCPLTIISRYDPPTFEPVKDILKLPWRFVGRVEDL